MNLPIVTKNLELETQELVRMDCLTNMLDSLNFDNVYEDEQILCLYRSKYYKTKNSKPRSYFFNSLVYRKNAIKKDYKRLSCDLENSCFLENYITKKLYDAYTLYSNFSKTKQKTQFDKNRSLFLLDHLIARNKVKLENVQKMKQIYEQSMFFVNEIYKDLFGNKIE